MTEAQYNVMCTHRNLHLHLKAAAKSTLLCGRWANKLEQVVEFALEGRHREDVMDCITLTLQR